MAARRERSARWDDRRVSSGAPTRRVERGRGDGARARAMQERGRAAARDRHVVADRARRGARGRRAAPLGPDARTARRRAGVREGDLRHGGAADDGLERRVGADLSRAGAARRTRGGAAPCFGGDRARQDGGGRLRVSRQRHEQPDRTGAQPARSERHAHAGRIERRIGGGRGDGDGVRRARHRRRRLEPDSGAVHGRGGDEADVRARGAHRRDPDVAVSRHARPARAARGRRGAAARGRGGSGCVGSARDRDVERRVTRDVARGRARGRTTRHRGGARAARADDRRSDGDMGSRGGGAARGGGDGGTVHAGGDARGLSRHVRGRGAREATSASTRSRRHRRRMRCCATSRVARATRARPCDAGTRHIVRSTTRCRRRTRNASRCWIGRCATIRRDARSRGRAPR